MIVNMKNHHFEINRTDQRMGRVEVMGGGGLSDNSDFRLKETATFNLRI
jgi:hypothetical protein